MQIEDLLAGAPEEPEPTVLAGPAPIWRRALPWAPTGALAAALAAVLVLLGAVAHGARTGPPDV